MDKVYIFDTTLRDGEQSPGASLNIEEKIEIAHALKKLNVDIIEAGFPISSIGDFESVKRVAKEIKNVTIAGLARAVKKDIDTCYEAVKYAKQRRIHTFIATSNIHLKYKLKKSKDEVYKEAVEAVKYASKYPVEVEFSAEDAVRTDFDFLCRVVEGVISAGAKVVNIPDTVGYSVPSEFGMMINKLYETVPNIHKAVISVHCHNDLGLGAANSISALQNGARQIECTINGLGERAGNAALEEIIMALNTRKDILKFKTDINTKEIARTSRLVSTLTGIPVQPNKAIVGENAFAHEAGIHQHGVMAKSATYEIMTPESIGLEENKLVLGKHSGRHAFRKKLSDMGYKLSDKKIDALFYQFKELADKKKTIYDADIEALVEDEISRFEETFKLLYFNVTSGNSTIPTATVKLAKADSKKKGKEEIVQEAACGDGPIDAAYKAIDRITGITCKLEGYSLRSVSGGKDAVGEVTVKVRVDKKGIVSGRGTSTDIVEASVKAYVNAMNRSKA
ncbi:MAG: 2-isopropylmalate synthase [Elusimicrobiota bacterium]